MWNLIICKLFGHTIGDAMPFSLFDLMKKPNHEASMTLCQRCGDWHISSLFVQYDELKNISTGKFHE